MNRKIVLPSYCNPFTKYTVGGNDYCDHDYPPESKIEHEEFVEWSCSKCKMVLKCEVYS